MNAQPGHFVWIFVGGMGVLSCGGKWGSRVNARCS